MKEYRHLLREYIRRTGRELIKNGSSFKMICPSHADTRPSCHVNAETLHCYGCGFQGDIYDLAGIDKGLSSFPEQSDFLRELFGDRTPADIPAPKPIERRDPGKSVALTPDIASRVYSKKSIEHIAEFMHLKNPEEPIFYRDRFGRVTGADVRLYDDDGDKAVITFYYNGRSIAAKNPPVLLYNLDRIANEPDKPILVVEGAKSAVAAEAIDGFIPTTWSRGTNSLPLADWSPLKGRTVYMYPDDDEPGQKAALALLNVFPDLKIVPPHPKARELKAKGADIVEALQVETPERLRAYILEDRSQVVEEVVDDIGTPLFPFKILGTGDDGRMYALDRQGRLRDYNKNRLNQGDLLTLAPLDFWLTYYKTKKGAVDVRRAADDVLSLCDPDFDPDIIRGRGAWRESDGRICYHDGLETYGETSPERLYVRKSRKDIGIMDEHIEVDHLKKISELVEGMSFETEIDAKRFLGWSAIAAFGGAQPWRPALLLTGESGSGKTTVLDRVARPLSAGMTVSGGGSTEAGVRQAVGLDSCAVLVEEAEGDTPNKKANRDAMFSLMRQSTSDDSPQIVKGTKEQTGIRFIIRSNFLFVAIDPSIEFAADDNRIFRINMVKPSKAQEDNYKRTERELMRLLDEESCRRIRAFVFANLKKIIDTAQEISDVVRDCSGRDLRFGLADGLLWSAYWLVWEGREEVTREFAREYLSKVYATKPEEPRRNESVELVDLIMDSLVDVAGDFRKKITVREACYYAEYGELDDYRPGAAMREDIVQALHRHGIKIQEDGIAFSTKHPAIEKATGLQEYTRIIWRHPNLVEKNRRIRILGTKRTVAVVSGLIESDSPRYLTDDVKGPAYYSPENGVY